MTETIITTRYYDAESGAKRIVITRGSDEWSVAADHSFGDMAGDSAQHLYAISRLLNLSPTLISLTAQHPTGFSFAVNGRPTWPAWRGREPEAWVPAVDDEKTPDPEEPRIRDIEGVITLTDDTTSRFIITTGGGYTQWGADLARLGLSVDAVSAMSEALTENDLIEED